MGGVDCSHDLQLKIRKCQLTLDDVVLVEIDYLGALLATHMNQDGHHLLLLVYILFQDICVTILG